MISKKKVAMKRLFFDYFFESRSGGKKVSIFSSSFSFFFFFSLSLSLSAPNKPTPPQTKKKQKLTLPSRAPA